MVKLLARGERDGEPGIGFHLDLREAADAVARGLPPNSGASSTRGSMVRATLALEGGRRDDEIDELPQLAAASKRVAEALRSGALYSWIEPPEAVGGAELLGLDAAMGRHLRHLAEAEPGDLAFQALVEDGRTLNPRVAELCATLLESPDGAFHVHYAARWTAAAFPVVEIGHKLAASFCCTGATGAEPEDLRCPWRAFAIRVPPGLLSLRRTAGELDQVHTIRVFEHADWERISIIAHGGYVQSWTRGLPRADFLTDGSPDENTDEDSPFNVGLEEYDERSMVLARRLVRGVILWLNDRERREAARQAAPSAKAARARRGRHRRGPAGALPSLSRYVISAPVVVDCRPVVESYATGESRRITMRSLVRGHFKRQHHGPRNELVKIIWREPFMRGPDGAPMAVRPHVVRE